MPQDLRELATVARFNGHCSLCPARIIAGADSIVCVDGDWVHAECAEDHELQPDPPEHERWEPPFEKPGWWED